MCRKNPYKRNGIRWLGFHTLLTGFNFLDVGVHLYLINTSLFRIHNYQKEIGASRKVLQSHNADRKGVSTIVGIPCACYIICILFPFIFYHLISTQPATRVHPLYNQLYLFEIKMFYNSTVGIFCACIDCQLSSFAVAISSQFPKGKLPQNGMVLNINRRRWYGLLV